MNTDSVERRGFRHRDQDVAGNVELLHPGERPVRHDLLVHGEHRASHLRDECVTLVAACAINAFGIG